ncbi:DUF961 family protein [Enterococcus casseliflavus]|uniref:DUF961 family protein n=18 Tax=Bacillota TaxID=1239 RepID=UPI0025439819|nr:DUF961 family protein [Enterococcus casseliflavus]MDK4451536.1 DUF961 family protein [Enterococcus casseliflavus]
MELKFVIPNMEKTFGNLEFAGEDKVVQRRINGRLTVLSRSYNLYSDVQRADDIVVVLPAEAGEKHFGFEERVKLVNPRITAEGYKIGTRGFTNYLLHADDMIPFTVDEYTSIGELNRLWEMVSELPEELQSELSALLTHFSSIEELSEHQEDIIIHSDCDDMYDVARYYIEETGALGEVPASLQNYIDYQAYGRDLDLSGTFISTNHGIFEIVY